MKRNVSMPVILVTLTIFMLFNSCIKNVPPKGFFNPLIGGCQVAEYHGSQFDALFPTKPPYLFRKTFDPSGRIVKEIDCSINDDIIPNTLLSIFTLHLAVEQKDRVVFLIKKDTTEEINAPDTVARIYLNTEGRPDSCVGKPGLDLPQDEDFETERYFYKNGRLLAVYDSTFRTPFFFTATDTIHYDKFGNPLSFRDNSYQYDYTRRAKRQFYCDDFMEVDGEFYILQYLGFFPEVTSPPNLRTRVVNVDFAQGTPVANQQFDAEGKLTGYTIFGEAISITWNCH